MGRASRRKREKREQELLALKLQVQILQARPIQTNQPGIWRRIPPIGKAAIGLAIAVFGLWVGYVQTIKPRIHIQPPSQLVDPQNPYDAPFTLTNDGYLTVHSVTIDCVPALVAVNGLRPASKEFPWDLKTLGTARIRTLDALYPDDPKPFVCDTFRNLQPTNVSIVGVEIQVTVKVNPFSLVYWPYSKSILFEADSNGTEKFQWHELAIGEEPDFPKADMLMKLRPDSRMQGAVRH